MDVELNLFGPYRDAVGSKSLEVTVDDGATVRELFRTLGEDHPDLSAKILDDGGDLVGSVTVTKNGRDVKLIDGADTIIEDGDVLRAAPPVHGG